jgi:murein DD-endopeptidase MepM/ murein hydrolase activator NlpD
VALHPAVFVPVFSLAVVILAIFVSSYFIQVNKIQKGLDSTIDEYLIQIQGQIKELDNFMVDTEGDLTVLKEDLERSKDDFDFNKHNAYANVMRLSEELTKYLPARKEAYKLIASNIKEAVSYGEIIYEMSQLPSEEYQARIFLATEEQRVMPLSTYIPVFEDMVYPVAVDGLDNDGRGFRITDGFMEKREDPLGSGGVAPHFAVDIINVSNIDFISYAGEIIREGMPDGDVTAVYEGVIKSIEEEDPRYGCIIEIEHPLSKEVKTMYPDADSWSTAYAHMRVNPFVEKGQWVNTADPIGLIGNTGHSTGPHLHFEVRIYRKGGTYVDEHGVRFDKVNPFPPENKK